MQIQNALLHVALCVDLNECTHVMFKINCGKRFIHIQILDYLNFTLNFGYGSQQAGGNNNIFILLNAKPRSLSSEL